MSIAMPQRDAPPQTLAGLSFGQWSFAVRIWLAMVLALALAFWLQLESADTAAVTIGVLAQPRRGQAFRKAVFFFSATLVGVLVSFAIAAVFTQARDLFLLVFAAWLALCVYVAAFFDGTRSYGAVLLGYTVSIVAVSQIDSPQDMFAAGVSRLAAISIGIASVVFINDVLASPTVYPTVRDRLAAAHERTRALVAALVSGDVPPPGAIVELFGAITGTRLDIQAIAAEDAGGRRRAAAAGSAATAMIEALGTARGFAFMLCDMAEAERAELRAWIATEDGEAPRAALDTALAAPARATDRVMHLTITASLIDHLRLAKDELVALEAGQAASRQVALPIHRDREVARLAAVRVFLAVLIASTLLVLSGWPKTSSCLLFVSVLASLSSTMPDARAFARSAMVALPIAACIATVVEFVLLNGISAFPILALGLAPSVILATFLMQRPQTATIGSLILTFTVVNLSPANPQSYNAQDFVTSAVLVVSAAFLFGGLLFAFFPVTAKDRRRWMVNRARADLLDAMADRPRHGPADMAYLAADRIVALSRFPVGSDASRRWRMSYTLLLSVLTMDVGRAQRRLDTLPSGVIPVDLETLARAAFMRLDGPALAEAADRLLAAAAALPAEQRRRVAGVVADLGLAARIVALHPSELRHLRGAVPA